MIAAIHQPNFLPWLGFFDKMARADTFILLDHVQLPKTGGSWTNRVKVAVAGAAAWLTVPIHRDFDGVRSIADTRIDDTKPWRTKMRKTLQSNYGRAPHRTETMELVDEILAYDGERLAEMNIRALRRILTALGWSDRTLVLSSSLGCAGQGTELLVALAAAVGADTYLAGGGAASYQDDETFGRHGIRVEYQNFQHPEYRQSRGGGFIPGLSIVDALFELGARATGRLLTGEPRAASGC